MGIEHSFKENDRQVMRCPKCEVLTLEKVGEETPYVSFFAGISSEYFICHNPKCEVDRIYSENAISLRK